MSYKDIKKYRNSLKQFITDEMGGKCIICKYDKCHSALECHHVDVINKKFNISTWKKVSVKSVITEAAKCILVCTNCHREIHEKITKIPIDIKFIDVDYCVKKYQDRRKDYCPMCKSQKSKRKKFCGAKCANKFKQRVDWDNIDLHDLLFIKKMTVYAIGKMLNINGNSVIKRAKKLNLPISVKDRLEYINKITQENLV